MSSFPENRGLNGLALRSLSKANTHKSQSVDNTLRLIFC